MIRIGIIGTGGMARQHARNFKAAVGCRVAACADIVPGKAKAFAETHGIPASYEDYGEMLAREKLDAVSIVTIDSVHAPAALAAIGRGLHVMCEKPLADSVANARKMARAAGRAGIITAVNFSWRNPPASQKAAQIASSGALGELRHIEGHYLQCWLTQDWQTSPPLLWRLSSRHGSMGVLGDIGVHILDLVTFIAGDISELACELTIFDKGVKRIGKYVFDVNDSMLTIARFKNGARGTLNATRWAKGCGNSVALRVHGTRGALDLDLERPPEEQLKVSLGKGLNALKWSAVKCPPAPNQQARFVRAITTGKQGQTSFEGGLKIQEYLEACCKSARRNGAWVNPGR